MVLAGSITTKFAVVSLLMLLAATPASSVSFSLPTSVQQRIDLRPATVPHDIYDNEDNDTIPLKVADGERWAICGGWLQSANTVYFHIVFTLLLVAFLAPANNFGAIWLRAAVVCASLVMFYSSWFHECDQEKFIWAALIFFVNFVYLAISLIKLRPVKFDKEIECVSTTSRFEFFFCCGNHTKTQLLCLFCLCVGRWNFIQSCKHFKRSRLMCSIHNFEFKSTYIYWPKRLFLCVNAPTPSCTHYHTVALFWNFYGL